MGVVFGVIWVTDFNDVIRFYVQRHARRPRVTRRPMVTRRPPSHQNSKKMTDISLWVSIWGLFGLLISMMTLDFTSVASAAGQRSPAARRHTKIKEDDKYIVMGIDFWVIWVADFNNVIRFYVRRRLKVTRRPPSH